MYLTPKIRFWDNLREHGYVVFGIQGLLHSHSVILDSSRAHDCISSMQHSRSVQQDQLQYTLGIYIFSIVLAALVKLHVKQ